MANEETTDQAYQFTNELKELLVQNLANKPYGEVYKVLEFLSQNETGVITESQLNVILNYLSKITYSQVAGFFSTLPTLLVKVESVSEAAPVNAPEETAPVAKREKVADNPPKAKAKAKPAPVVEEVTEEASFEDALDDIDNLI